MVKIFYYRGKTMQELQDMTLQEFSKLVPSRIRRRLGRGFNVVEKKFVNEVLAARKNRDKTAIKTHCRDVVITPHMIGTVISVHNGKEFTTFEILPQMIGHYLGEFALTRKRVQHGAPGMGATKSSLFVPLK